MSAGLPGLNPVSFIHTVDYDVFNIPGGFAEFICSRLAGGMIELFQGIACLMPIRI